VEGPKVRCFDPALFSFWSPVPCFWCDPLLLMEVFVCRSRVGERAVSFTSFPSRSTLRKSTTHFYKGKDVSSCVLKCGCLSGGSRSCVCRSFITGHGMHPTGQKQDVGMREHRTREGMHITERRSWALCCWALCAPSPQRRVHSKSHTAHSLWLHSCAVCRPLIRDKLETWT